MSLALPPAANPAPREKKSDRTRRRVLSAAKHLFDRRGYRDTTVDDITRRADIAHGTFYLHFKGKSEVLRELSDTALSEFDSIATREFQTREDVVGLITQTLEVYQRNRLMMRLLREASTTDSYVRKHYDEVFVGMLVGHLQENIERTNAAHRSTARIDARAAARAIVGMVESFAYGVFVGGEPFTIDEAVDILTTFCVRGIGLDLAKP
ncbi:MAG: TetR/AcrR family transcriptional regulator [Candidatus Dormibacteria bacterium]